VRQGSVPSSSRGANTAAAVGRVAEAGGPRGGGRFLGGKVDVADGEVVRAAFPPGVVEHLVVDAEREPVCECEFDFVDGGPRETGAGFVVVLVPDGAPVVDCDQADLRGVVGAGGCSRRRRP
jgi:hypothetical protein